MKTDNITCKKCLGSGLVPNPKTIGRRLKKLRKDAGLSLTAVKTALRVSHGYVSLMESGKATITTARVRQYRDAVSKLSKSK
jgi:transcriptional regulator with XRE-family HTH domain